MKYLRNHNISIHINFYQNRFINECARKKKAKIPEFRSFTVSEFHSFRVSQFQSFFVRCRRTYVLNNIRQRTSISNNLFQQKFAKLYYNEHKIKWGLRHYINIYLRFAIGIFEIIFQKNFKCVYHPYWKKIYIYNLFFSAIFLNWRFH